MQKIFIKFVKYLNRQGKNILSRLTMKMHSYAFTDIVSGRAVYNFVDCYGEIYQAEFPYYVWSFRVKK
jgi:hypothetical protein